MTPIKSEDQILPSAAILKRGRLDLGVVLCIRGNKIHYYSFINQRKVAVFENWLFQMPVKLGQQCVRDFVHLKKLMTVKIENQDNKCTRKINGVHKDLFSNIRATFSKVEAITLSNCINTNSNTMFEKLDLIYKDIKDLKMISNNNERDIQAILKQFSCASERDKVKTRIQMEQISELADTISTLERELKALRLENYHQENHVTTTLNFNDCYFNQPTEEYQSKASTFFEDEDLRDQQSNASEVDEDPNELKCGTSSDKDKVRVFTVNSVITEHHWNKFQMYYSKYPLMDVFFAEITWMKNNGMLELVEQIAPYIMGKAPPILDQPVVQSLWILFNILRTSRICR